MMARSEKMEDGGKCRVAQKVFLNFDFALQYVTPPSKWVVLKLQNFAIGGRHDRAAFPIGVIRHFASASPYHPHFLL